MEGVCAAQGGWKRHVLFSQGTWEAFKAIRSDAREDAPVFVSRKGSPLSVSQAFRIVRAVARREMELVQGVKAHPFWSQS